MLSDKRYAMGEKQLVYIVEDDASIRELEIYALKNSEFEVKGFESGKSMMAQLENKAADIILLDIMLPDGNGLDLLAELHALGKHTNVIILSAKDSLEDKVNGLDLGADDYLPKPFHLAELHARIKSLFRRKLREGERKLQVGNVELFPDDFRVMVQGKEIELNRKEYDILNYFMSRPGRLVNKNTLAESVWGDHIDQVDNFDFIYAQIKNLRKRLKDAGATPELKSVYGFGYKFVVE